MAGMAAIAGVTFGIKSVIQINAELSDSFADVMKTTGLAKDEVIELNKAFKGLNTRTSQKELLDLARDAGKLGYSAKEDIMAFVRAGDQIRVALGEDLGEDAIKNIAKLNELFGETKKLGMEKALLSTGSAINSLGQSSTASEPYMVDFAKRLGGIGASANISIPNILGMAATLDQLGQTSEVSSSAMNKFIVNLFKDTEKIAKAAGIEINVLNKALKEDTNEALIMVFEALNKKGGLADLAPLFGELGTEGVRAGSVISALAQNVGILKDQQKLANDEFEKANSVTAEFNVKNENLAATLEKVGKNIKNWFDNSALSKFLSTFFSGLEKATRASKDLNTQLDEQLKHVADLDKDIAPLVDRYENLNNMTERSVEEQEELQNIIKQIDKVLPAAAAATDEYGNAISISTDKVRELIVAKKEQLELLKKEAVEDAKKALEKAKKEPAKIGKQLDSLRTMKPSKLGGFEVTEELIAAKMERLRDQQEKAFADIKEKQKQYDDITGKTLDNYIAAEQAKVQAQEETIQKQKEYMLKTLDDLNILASANDEFAQNELDRRKKLNQQLADEDEERKKQDAERKKQADEENQKYFEKRLKQLEQQNTKEKNVLKQNYIDGIFTQKEFNDAILKQEEEYADKKIILYKKFGQDTLDLDTKILDDRIKMLEAVQSEIDKLIKDLDKDFEKNQADFVKAFSTKVKDDIKSVSKDNDEFLKNLIKTKREVDSFKNTWLELSPFEERNNELAELERLYKTKLMSHEEYTRMKAAIDKKYNQAMLKDWSNYLSAANDLVGVATSYYEMQKARELAAVGDNEEAKDAIERKYFEKQKKAQIAEARIAGGLAIMQIWSGKISGNPVVDAIIKGALTVAQIAKTEMEVSKMKSQTYSGGGGSAGGTTERIIATGKESGGKFNVKRVQDGKTFSAEIDPAKRGYIGKPTVLVGESGEEFVVNAEGVNNPTIKPILDIINAAQEHGAVSTLNLPAAIQGRENGGSFSGNVSGNNIPGTNDKVISDLKTTLDELVSLLSDLQKNQIKAYMVFSEFNRAVELQNRSDSLGNRNN